MARKKGKGKGCRGIFSAYVTTYAYAVPVILGALVGCASAAACASAAPCSRQSLAQTEVECAARIKLECAKGDKSCPAYVECSKRIENWRVCRSE
jgi:hypothetical protein